MKRRLYDLTDREWSIIEPLLPNKARGVPRVDDRRVLNGILWRFRTGSHGPRYPSATPPDDLLQPVRPLAQSWGVGPASGSGFRSSRRRDRDDRFYLCPRPPAWCDG